MVVEVAEGVKGHRVGDKVGRYGAAVVRDQLLYTHNAARNVASAGSWKIGTRYVCR